MKVGQGPNVVFSDNKLSEQTHPEGEHMCTDDLRHDLTDRMPGWG